MPRTTYREQAEQTLRETQAFYAANPLPASHKFAMNPANQPFLNCPTPYKKIPLVGKVRLRDFLFTGNNHRDFGERRPAPAIFGQLLAALLALAFASGAAFWIYNTFELNSLLAREGVVAEARVTDKYTRDSRTTQGRTERNYYLAFDLAYPDASGQSQVLHKTESVSPAIYNSHKVGGPIQLIYWPGDPNKFLISNTGPDLGMTLLLALAIIPGGLIVAVFQAGQFVRQLRKRGKLKKGQFLTGYITNQEIKNNLTGKPASVALAYRFVGPEGQPLYGRKTFPARYFKGRWHLAGPQKPLTVLYQNERSYEVL